MTIEKAKPGIIARFLAFGDAQADKIGHVGAGALAAGVPFHALTLAEVAAPFAFAAGVIACGAAAILREWAGLKTGRPWSNLDILATALGGVLVLA